MTGGHLYHQRMVEAARHHDASITFAQARLGHPPPHDCDVLVIDSLTAWRLAPVLVTGRLRRSLVAMVHQQPGGVDTGPAWRRPQRSLDRFVYRRCDLVLAASSSLTEALVAEHGVDPARVRLVEPGCDLPAGTAPGDLRRGRRIAVVCVSNWYPNKGLLDLLDAVSGLPVTDVTLHLAGRDDVDPDETDRIRQRLAAGDLAERVAVHGAVDRQGVADLYAGADVFVLPSRVEGYATVLAEALKAGLPVVAWRRPHVERLATDGVQGCLIPPGDVDGLRGALGRLAADDDHRLRLAAGARRRGAQLPTWDDTAAGFFSALRGASSVAVQPANNRAARLDVDPADAGVLHEHAPGDLVAHTESPRQSRLDRADVRDDHHD